MQSFTFTLITSVLSSSLISGLITILFWNRQKGVEFNWDYKKYILGKRQTAYDEVQKVINLCLLKKTYHGNYQVNSFFSSENHLKDFIQFTEIVKSGWVSKDVTNVLMNLREIATKGLDHLLNYDWENISEQERYEGRFTPIDVLERYGNENLAEINSLSEKLQKTYISDLKELGNIDKFIKGLN